MIKVTATCEACGLVFEFEKQKSSKPDKRACSNQCSYALRVQSRRKIYDPIEKVCLECKLVFEDTSKKKLVSKCKVCINTEMVRTRNSHGSYARSESQNKKLSNTLRQKYDAGWDPLSLEGRQKLADSMKTRWQSGDMSEKTKMTCQEKYGAEHWTKSSIGREKLSELSKGRILSATARKNMSDAHSRRIRSSGNHYQRGNGGYREDLGHNVRSNWEANFSRILKLQGKDYEYEPVTFELDNATSYTPDFRIEGVFYEVKGYLTETAKKKLDAFKSKFHDVPFVLINGVEYNKLRDEYQDKILWEGK